MNTTDTLERFTARQSDDDVKRDLELTCDVCGSVLCDIEPGDTLAVLVRVTEDHGCDEDTPGVRERITELELEAVSRWGAATFPEGETPSWGELADVDHTRWLDDDDADELIRLRTIAEG